MLKRFWLVCLLLSAIASLALPAAAQQFSEVGATLGLSSTNGAAWGDYDNDGYPDLYVGALWQSHGPQLLHNNGDGSFSDVTAAMGLPTSYSEDDGVAWADYDNDGDLDLMISHGNSPIRLWRNDGAGFVDVATAAGFTMRNGGRTISWGDYDRDN